MSKSVMRVLMITLVAMLGVTAKAHYIVVGGRCYWHSGQCVRKDEDVPIFPIREILMGEIVAKPQSVEILCPIPPLIRQFNQQNLPGLTDVALVSRKPIDQGDYTERRDTLIPSTIVSANLEWHGIVSDALFLEGPGDPNDNEDFALCSPDIPRDMIIRSMSVEMNLYICLDPTNCPSNLDRVHSGWKATCTLSDEFNLRRYPRNLPPRGARFDCSDNFFCHDDNDGLGCNYP